MEFVVTFKRFYRTVAFIIFLTSLYFSFDRYINDTPIQSTEHELLKNFESMPSILICAKHQFDAEAAKNDGYTTFDLFYNGIIVSTFIIIQYTTPWRDLLQSKQR